MAEYVRARAIVYPRGLEDATGELAKKQLHLTQAEVVEQAARIKGRPIWLEHAEPDGPTQPPTTADLTASREAFSKAVDPGHNRVQVGVIEEGTVNEQGQLVAEFKLDRRTAAGAAAIARMHRGELAMSVGQKYKLDDALDIQDKSICEVSLVDDPYFPEARVLWIEEDTPEFRETRQRLRNKIVASTSADLKPARNLEVSPPVLSPVSTARPQKKTSSATVSIQESRALLARLLNPTTTIMTTASKTSAPAAAVPTTTPVAPTVAAVIANPAAAVAAALGKGDPMALAASEQRGAEVTLPEEDLRQLAEEVRAYRSLGKTPAQLKEDTDRLRRVEEAQREAKRQKMDSIIQNTITQVTAVLAAEGLTLDEEAKRMISAIPDLPPDQGDAALKYTEIATACAKAARDNRATIDTMQAQLDAERAEKQAIKEQAERQMARQRYRDDALGLRPVSEYGTTYGGTPQQTTTSTGPAAATSSMGGTYRSALVPMATTPTTTTTPAPAAQNGGSARPAAGVPTGNNTVRGTAALPGGDLPFTIQGVPETSNLGKLMTLYSARPMGLNTATGERVLPLFEPPKDPKDVGLIAAWAARVWDTSAPLPH